ncbi:tripartite motif-containing protein 16 [Carassius gibelio]|uniref:tripartite motif-containing protein 16 n=1 Tax=Carassius gibelio TaxID=101364 RepID=UPI0022777D21|nr:tripartite motif-containing protein 16 [Carassius gibelio]XP_052407059.1 tripartite motif-containing protein 16 [Carassius gibelio]
MAEASISVDREQFICSVCLDLLQDPVTVPCGHNYCKKCITDVWDFDQKGIHRCPLCKPSFTPRPGLGKNLVIAEMVEKLKKTRSQAAAPASVHTGSGDVQCDSCTGIKQKAVKSCLDCRSSYCQNHLDQHESLFRGKGHDLMDATGRLQDMMCSRHGKILEIYCRTDQRCICMLCLVDEHRNHDTVSTSAARTEKQKHLGETQIKLNQKIQKKEKDIQELKEAVASHKRSAQTAVEDSEKIFTELVRSIEKRRSEVTKMIRDQERAAVSRAEIKLERLEKEINELKKRDAELKQLSHTQDHVHFLQSLSSASVSGSTDGYSVSPHLTFSDVVNSVSQFRDKLQQFCREETEHMTETVKAIQVIIAPEYETREEFLQYFHPFVLDSNTIYPSLHLSEDNTVITSSSCNYRYPNHPDRFDYWIEALCTESVGGRCYWEVEYGGNEGVHIAVAYKSIKRKGQGGDSRFGYNDQSWRLYCCNSSCSFRHNTIRTVLPVVSSRKIGVYVDHSAGTLSFLSIADTINLIHRVQTTFTQPLYPGIGLQNNTTVKLCRLNV